MNQTIPCTDPARDCTNYLHSTRVMYYEAPGLTVAGAQALNDQANTPLATTLRPWRGSGGPGAVGGIAELPALTGTSAEGAGAPPEASGCLAGGYAALAGGLAAAVVAVTAGVWNTSRRWLGLQ